MPKPLMMASGLLAAVRFPFAYTVLTITAVGSAFVPWGSVWSFMELMPGGALSGPLVALACVSVWLWAIINVAFALSSLAITIIYVPELSEYPLWWTFCIKRERHIEVWRVLLWLFLVPAELASIIALLPVYGFVRFLRAVMTFDLAKLRRKCHHRTQY